MRIHYPFILAIALMAMFSCSVIEEQNPVVVNNSTELIFEATAEGDVQTKTAVQSNGTSVWWNPHESINIFFGASESSRFTSTNEEPVARAQFRGTIEAFTGEVDGTDADYFWAIYPYNESNTCDGSSVTATLSANQVACPETFADNQWLTVARSQGLALSFRAVCAGFRFSVTMPGVTSVTFKGNNNEILAGKARIGMDDNNLPVVLENITEEREITLSAPEGEMLEVGTLYYMTFFPNDFTEGFTVTFNTETATGIRVYDSAKDFKRTDVHRGVNFDANIEYIQNQTDPIVNYYFRVNSAEELVVGGKYIFVYESGSKAFKPILNNSKNGLVAGADNVFPVTIENGCIQSTEDVDACQVEIEPASSGYYFKAVAADGFYFYPNSSSISASSTASTSNTISFNSGNVTIKAGSRYFKYSTSSNYFKGSSSSGALALYLLDEGRQNLQFSSSAFSFGLYGRAVPLELTEAPVLSGAKTRVTYTSSDPSVATIEQYTGKVTVQGIGQTVISAMAEASSIYQEGTASYTLTICDELVYNIENDMLAAFLDAVEASPYDPDDYSVTHMLASIYGGTSESNRLDWPKPVPISWANPTSGNDVKVIYVYNDEAKTSLETTVEVSSTTSTSADVYNLIPNRDYYYSVTNGGSEIKTGRFSTTGRRRMMKVGDSPYGQQYANNCRDFGGQITESGQMIKYGKIYRGSNMDGTASSGQDAYLLGYMGVGLDVDLRTDSGTAGGGSNALYDALGLNDWHTSQTFNSWSDLSSQSKMSTILSKVFDAVANDKVVYIHCMVGADRTGYVCMLLEALLGLSQGSCDADYELTSFSAAVGTRTRTGTGNYYYRTKNGTTQGVDFINTFDGDTFQEKAINYVTSTDKGLGISIETIQAFQDKMLE